MARKLKLPGINKTQLYEKVIQKIHPRLIEKNQPRKRTDKKIKVFNLQRGFCYYGTGRKGRWVFWRGQFKNAFFYKINLLGYSQ
jgi:hypothetical protein